MPQPEKGKQSSRRGVNKLPWIRGSGDAVGNFITGPRGAHPRRKFFVAVVVSGQPPFIPRPTHFGQGGVVGGIVDALSIPQAPDDSPRDVAVHDDSGNEELLPYEAKGPPLLLIAGLQNLAEALFVANEIAEEIRLGIYRWETASEMNEFDDPY